MSAYLENLYTALRTRIAAVWTDVVPNGIYEAEHVELLPWETLNPPYAVIAIDSLPEATEYGAANQVYAPQVEIYVVREVAGPLSGIRGQLEALRDDLWTEPLLMGQVLSIPSLSWSLQLLPNQIFASKNMAHRAGRLVAEVLIGQVLDVATP